MYKCYEKDVVYIVNSSFFLGREVKNGSGRRRGIIWSRGDGSFLFLF